MSEIIICRGCGNRGTIVSVELNGTERDESCPSCAGRGYMRDPVLFRPVPRKSMETIISEAMAKFVAQERRMRR